ncbi:MFS general substrate transporter [Periconia macrospinosa]|uniref:MFS general substrate transporter n=1 Tax=Periconia macrospinosa TaxID=97972 RepID=A0A2V1DX33_9PLEO|nr:MFS general substrate transporter [Periconia macrospinosa]
MAIKRLNNPLVQNFLASVIVSLLPGIYVALTVLGAGGGPSNATRMANISNSVLYAIYFTFGLFSGSVVSTIGPRYTFLIGSLGYPVFVGSMWYFSNTGHIWFPIFGGALLGMTAVLLWTAAGFIAFSYATEQKKGAYISMQWGLLSFGSTLASLVAFGINYNAPVVKCPDSVYIAFIVIMCLSFFVAFFGIVKPSDVRREDGSAIAHHEHKGWLTELKNQRQIFMDWRMLVLVIPMFGSEIALIIFSTLNSLYFNVRTRSLNSLVFVIMQGIGAIAIAPLLDSQKFRSRKIRGLISTAVMGVFTVATWIGLLVWLDNNPLDPLSPPLWSYAEPPFGGFIVLTLLLGINMTIYQVVVQWIVAALSNDPETLARYAGFSKGCLAGGLCAIFGTEAAGTLTQMDVTAFCFVLQGTGLVCMICVCWFGVKDTKEDSDDGIAASVTDFSERK